MVDDAGSVRPMPLPLPLPAREPRTYTTQWPPLRRFQCPRTRVELSAGAVGRADAIRSFAAVAVERNGESLATVPAPNVERGLTQEQHRHPQRNRRGRRSQQQHRDRRRAARAAQQQQRSEQQRGSDSTGDDSAILQAIGAQVAMIQQLTASVQQLARGISNFLFAQQRANGRSADAQHRGAAGKESELRRKSDAEFERVERLLREKLAEIQTARVQQAVERGGQQLADTIQQQYEGEKIEEQIRDAMAAERQYEHCSYKRTACKAAEDLVLKYNQVRSAFEYESENRWQYKCVDAEDGKQWAAVYYEKPGHKAFQFNQLGSVASQWGLLADPGRFWSYDLRRTQEYGERPLG